MKTFFATLFSVLVVLISFAQEDNTTGTNITTLHEIALNFSLKNDQKLDVLSSSKPYLISYKKINEDEACRYGLGGLFYNTKHINKSDTLDSLVQNRAVNFRFGYEKRKSFSKGFTYYYGTDFLAGYEGNKTVEYNMYNNYSKESSIQKAYFGFAPFLGLEYKINKHFYVFIEGAIRFQFYVSYNTFTNQSQQYINQYLDRQAVLKMSYPAMVFLAYRF